MAFLKILPGIGVLNDAGRTLPDRLHQVSDSLKSEILERDNHTCRYCGFRAEKYQEVNFIGPYTGKETALGADHYATACTFCWQCFHLEKIEAMQSGAVIWLPEISQPVLNHMVRAIYIARISQGSMADAARDALETLTNRREEAKSRLGTDNPHVLASVLHDFLEVTEYKQRAQRLRGFRILPLDRRIVREGDLEFNQFPQMLAHWRSKEGPFGELAPRNWPRLYFDVLNALDQAA